MVFLRDTEREFYIAKFNVFIAIALSQCGNVKIKDFISIFENNGFNLKNERKP